MHNKYNKNRYNTKTHNDNIINTNFFLILSKETKLKIITNITYHTVKSHIKIHKTFLYPTDLYLIIISFKIIIF